MTMTCTSYRFFPICPHLWRGLGFSRFLVLQKLGNGIRVGEHNFEILYPLFTCFICEDTKVRISIVLCLQIFQM